MFITTHGSENVKHFMSLDWSVHVVRMSNYRVVKKVFLGKPEINY